jgi:hypothetical protein
MANPFQNEPALSAGVVMAVLYILAAFGLPVSAEQQAVLQQNLPIVLPGLAALVVWIRQMVTPTAKVDEVKAEAFSAGRTAESFRLSGQTTESVAIAQRYGQA